MVRGVLITVAVIATITLLAWISLPYTTTHLLRSQFESEGWLLNRLLLQRPTGLQWRWSLLQFSSSDRQTDITASHIRLRPGTEDVTGLHLGIEQLDIVLGSSQEEDVDPAGWLSLYRQFLTLVPASGRVDRLELCPGRSDCHTVALVWWRQSDGVVVRAEPLESGTGWLYIRMQEEGIQAEIFRSGPHPFYISLRLALDNSESAGFNGKMLLTGDDWFTLLFTESDLPRGLDIDWQALNIEYEGNLLLQSVEQAIGLVENVDGKADLDWRAGWRWNSDALAVSSVDPHSAHLSLAGNSWEVELDPNYTAKVLRPDFPDLQVTALGAVKCRYDLGSLGCESDRVEIAGPLGVEDLSMETLIDRIELKDLLSDFPVAGIDLSLTLLDPRQEWLGGRARVDLAGGELKAVARQLAIGDVPLDSLVLNHSTITQAGGLKAGYDGDIDSFKRWLPGDFSGAIDIQLAAAWEGPVPDNWLEWPLSTEINVTATDVSGELEDTHWNGGQLELQLTGWPELSTPAPARMSWRSVDAGFPITELEMGFNVSGDARRSQIDLQGLDLSANTLGGSIFSDDFQFNLPAASGNLVLQLRQLDLLQVLSLEDEEFHSEGKLIGTIPVRIEQGNVIVDHGSVQTVAPGGLLQYNPSESVVKLAESSQQMATVLTALKNFHYDSLDAELNFGSDGLLRMDTSLEGHNPDFEQGRQIHFNLTVEEDLVSLLKSLQLTDRFADQIEKRMQ